jgi:NAD+ dependent glucose-6-phosphate dehydrogenase
MAPDEESEDAVTTERRRILLTGAAGRIGTAFRLAHGIDYRFVLADVRTDTLAETPGDGHEVVHLDVADADACKAACTGVDTVIHLAADPSPEAQWDSLLDSNIRGVVNIFRAAQEAGCRRVVYASSAHAVGGYEEQTIADDAAPRPTNLYGANKAFGEAIASTFAAGGLSSVAIRIGAYDAEWFHERGTAQDAAAYVSARDLNQLLVRGVEANDLQFAVVAGISDNRMKRFDLVHTRSVLGFDPQDDGFAVLGLPA